MIPMNVYPASSVVPIYFTSYGKTNGESITLTGLAVTDIEIYKGTSITQRASDAGYALIDTDGIDVDGVTGLHGFSIDLGDNTDAGFYAVGSFYTVVVSAVTIDAQTVTFIADRFRIVAAEAITGKPKVDVDGWLGTAAATPGTAGVPSVDTVRISTSATAADNAEAAWLGTINSFDDFVSATGTVTPGANTITSSVIAANAIGSSQIADGAIDAGALAADCITAAKLAADVTTELQSGLATAAALDTVDNFLDTEIADIQARLPAALTADGNIKADALRIGGTAQTGFDLGATRAEPGQGAPGATITWMAKIDYLYKNWRNKKTQTATQWSLLNDDAATVDHKATVADDGTTASKGEIATGP